MTARAITGLVAGLLVTSCVNTVIIPAENNKKPEILYIYPDGTMVFNDREMNEDEVIIYKDGFGGERAAVLLRIPYREDVFRDTIVVERKEVPIRRVK